MPSCCSSTRFGPISTSRRLPKRSTEFAARAAPLRWPMSELAVRILTGLILIAVALVAAFVGRRLSSPCWWPPSRPHVLRMDADRPRLGPALDVGGFLYALLPALACCGFAIATRRASTCCLWVFIVTWSTDIGAYFAGRSFGKRKLAPAISPEQDRRRPVGRHRRSHPARRRPGSGRSQPRARC